MSPQTAPQDRIPFWQMVVYGAGAFVNNILAGAIGGMAIVLNLALGMNPAWVGLLGALPRITDALTDPLVGYLSDHTRSRWGRRRPWIFVGAIAVGIIYALLWQIPENKSLEFVFGYFLVGSLIFYLAYTIFATPWVALGYELTPDFHERTRLMGVQNFMGQFAYLITPWFLWFMTKDSWFDDQMAGAATLAILVGMLAIGLGVLPALLLRERFLASPEEKAKPGLWASVVDFFKGLLTTIKSKPFLKLSVATFLVFNGFILISSFQFYVIIYYVFGGNEDLGAKWAGYSGTLGALSTFAVIPLVTMLGTRLGKRRAFFVTTGISMLGYCMKWFCYSPEHPWLLLLPAPFMAFGLGGLFTLMPSMIADVVDVDELNTHERREGMYGSIFWWVVKLGMAAALAGGGYMLNGTGFDVELGGDQTDRAILLMRLGDAFVPALASAVAIWVISSYKITEATAREVRDKLEARRGTGDAA